MTQLPVILAVLVAGIGRPPAMASAARRGGGDHPEALGAAAAAAPSATKAAPPLEIFAASCAASVVQKLSMHPLDTIKSRLQYARSAAGAVGGFSEVREIAKLINGPGGGVRNLYRGLTPALVGVIPTSLIYMPTYEAVKAHGYPALAGPLAGLAGTLVRVPMSVLKARVQLGVHASPMAALRSAVAAQGVRGLYAGLTATAVLDVVHATVQFAALERLTAAAVGRRKRPLTSAEEGVVGFITGATAAVATEPIDVIRTRLMAQRRAGAERGLAFGYTGIFHGLATAAKQEGILALWKGLLPRLVSMSCGSAIWYATYREARRRVAGLGGDGDGSDGALVPSLR